LKPPVFISGGGGLVSTMADYLRFCRMLLNGGSLDGVRLVSPKTLELMTANHLPGGKDLTELSVSLFSEATYSGVGFGLGFAVTLDPPRTLLPGTAGDFSWGGMASTYFWVDPREELIVIFMTQLMPSAVYPLRRELRTLVYSAFE
jgi:CubicO group peptidase (beta-lactamase class C family)